MSDSIETGGGRSAAFLKTPHPRLSSLIERKSLVGFALDRSGSMAPLATVAVQSVNELIEQQKEIAGNSRFTLTLFNQGIQLLHDAVPLSDISSLLPVQYQPSGGTALNDAVTHLIRSLSGHAHGRGSSVLAAILTDGEENHSRNTTARMSVRWSLTDG